VVPYKKDVVIATNLGRPSILHSGRFFGFGRAITRIIDEIAEISDVAPVSRNGQAPFESNGVAADDEPEGTRR
jgi:hypothetical protein